MKTISIGGIAFEVSTPYTEGQVLTAIEAKVLNQTRAENIGNNFRADVKKATEAPEAERAAKLDEVKAAIAKYDSEYTFSASVTRTPIDPIEAEALKIAREVLKIKIKDGKGLTVKEYLAVEGNQAKYDAGIEQIANQEDTLKEAKKRVAARKKVAELGGGEALDL